MLKKTRIAVALMVMAALALVTTRPLSGDVAVVAPGFEATNIITGLDRPTNIEFSPDGRIFVTEQGGLVKVYDGIGDTTPTVVADLRDATHSVDGRGLLGLALDPDFPTTSDLYVMYAHDAPIGGTAPTFGVPGADNDECPNPPGPGECVISGRISRLALNGDDIADSETVILEDWCQEWTSHSVGDLRFASDGSLYATSGEGAFAGQPDWGQRSGENGCDDPPIPHGGTSQDAATGEGGALRSQDLQTSGDPAGLSGTVIRIDKNTGEAHPGNPNYGDADPNVARIVAYGLRNPYRTALFPGTDDLWLGDVGWNDFEEINVVPDGEPEVLNFGWPCYEGEGLGYDIGNNICNNLLAQGPDAVEFPYWAYEQTVGFVPGGDGCLNNNGSPSALTFYDIGAYPAEYDGAFFFGDYSRRCIWAMLPGQDGRPDPSTVRVIMRDVAVTDLEIGPGGDVYAVNIFGGGGLGGTIVRLSYPAGEVTPLARMTATPISGTTPLEVNFDASSTDPGSPGDTLSFDWDFDGDGVYGEASGPVVSHTYTSEGRFTAQVRVTDQNGADAIASEVIFAGDPPVVTIASPATSTSWVVDDELIFAGSAIDGQGSPIPAADLTWDLILHHCETLTDCHTHNLGTIEDVESGSFFAPEHEYPSYIEIILTAVAPSGLTGSQARELYPDTALLSLEGDPAGVEAGFNGKPVPTPSVQEVIVGSSNTLSAASRQILGGQVYDFLAWSDGQPQTHDLVVTEDRTVSLTYAESNDPTFYFSSSSGGSVGGVAFADEDVIKYDSGLDAWSMVFDGSDVGVGAADVNGFAVISEDPLVLDLTFDTARTIPNLGAVDDSDLVRFIGVAGATTSGSFERLFDGSDVSLTSGGEDIDAVAVSGADWLFSTLGSFNSGTGVTGADEDLFRFAPTSIGLATAGSWSFAFDGSDVGIAARDLSGIAIDPVTGDLYGAALGTWVLAGVAGDKDDVFRFTADTLGETTSGTAEIVFDGDAHPGFGGETLDGVDVKIGGGAASASADLAVSIGVDAPSADLGDTVTYTVDVSNAGPDDATAVIATVSVPSGLVVTATSGCAGDPSGLPCDLGTITALGTAQFTVTADVDGSAGGLLSTSASVASAVTDPVGANNGDSAEVDVNVPNPPQANDDGPAPGSNPGDPFHIAEAGQLDVADGSIEDLDANDALGEPVAAIVSFGGGDLGGSVEDHPADTSVIATDGTLSVGGDGSFVFVPDTAFVGTFTFDYRLGNSAGSSDATVTIEVGQPPPPQGELILFSSSTGGNIAGVTFADEDVIGYDTTTDSWSMVFDGSDVGVGGSDVDGFSVISLDPLVVDLTFDAARSIPGVGSVDDSDLVRFTGVGGPDTSGTFALVFDGSDVGLSAGGEDIDAVARIGSDWLVSTWLNFGLPGGVSGADEDLARFTGVGGAATSGTWSIAFDGSDVGIGGRDLTGASYDDTSGDLYGAATGTWMIAGVSGQKSDVFRFSGALGPDTSGTAEIVFDGELHPGFETEQIDGLSVIPLG